MQDQIAAALGLDAIHALIEAPSAFLEKVKRERLRDPAPTRAKAKETYERVDYLMLAMREKKQRLLIGERVSQVPEAPIPAGDRELATHEFFLLKEFIYYYQRLRGLARVSYWGVYYKAPDLGDLFAMLDPERSGLPAFRLGPAFSERLTRLAQQKQDTALMLKHARRICLDKAKAELNLPQLKEEFVLPRSQKELIQTLQSSGRFVLSAENVANLSFRLADDAHCLALKTELGKLDELLEEEEDRVLKQLSSTMNKARGRLAKARSAAADMGWAYMLADFGLNYSCSTLKLGGTKDIRIRHARNLPLELHLKAAKRPYQMLELSFRAGVSVITGPNMGGKTSILKLLGQMALLARHGIPLPCSESRMPFFERVWYNHDSGAGEGDLSSFGREVVSFSAALAEEGFTLWLLDEFAKGTNPAEGEAIATGTLLHLAGREGFCVAATHFNTPALRGEFARFSVAGLDLAPSALAKLRDLRPSQRLKLLSEHMDYRLVPLKDHQAPPQCAIAVARVLGLPEEILGGAPKEE